MSKKMIYSFTVPVCGTENFSVVAESYEEALDKINNEDYFIDLRWMMLIGILDLETLRKCYLNAMH